MPRKIVIAAIVLAAGTVCAALLTATNSRTNTAPAGVACAVTVTPGTSSSVIEGDIASVGDGSTVCLAGGSYPRLTAKGAHHSSIVTVRSVPGETATVAGVQVIGSYYLRFAHLRMTEGFDVEDTPSFPGSHNLEFVENTFEEPLYGVMLRGIAGKPVTNVLIEKNYMHKVHLEEEEVAGNEKCKAGVGGQDVTIWEAEGVTVAYNTFNVAEWHYIQGGGSGPGGVTVEHNLFEGPDLERCAHLNAWQIWQGGENDTFRDNIVKGESPSNPAAVIALIFENGAGGSECSVKMKNDTIENNLFVNPSTSNVVQMGQIENLTIKNNTGVRFTTGWQMRSVCGSSTNVTETHNIMVEGRSSGAEKAGFVGFECTGECLFDDNVSSDTSANSSGATHYVTNWKPEWENTEYGNTGYYIPKGLPFKTGYQGHGGP